RTPEAIPRTTVRRTALLTRYPRFPATDPWGFPDREERTAVYSRILKQRVATFRAAQKDASGTKSCPEATFRLDLRPELQWPPVEVPMKEEDDRRRSTRVERREKRILGGSDPTLSGLAAAQRLRRRGSLPPKLPSRSPRSVAGRVVGEAVRNSESHYQ